MTISKITEVLDLWFSEPMNKHWFSSTPEIDSDIRTKYRTLWESAKSGELDECLASAEGCLALCIILDQFPLNMFRGKPESFSTEQQAVSIAKHAIKNDFHRGLANTQLAFLLMPLMHSENLIDQDISVFQFSQTSLEGNIRFAKHHRGIIEKFGRFPHRNSILGRKSTALELEYLQSDEAFTG